MTTVLLSAVIFLPANIAQSALAQADEAVAGSSAPAEVQTFRSAFDTFVTTDPQGYGIYDERDSSTFSPGEDIILYIEPVGFEYGTTGEDDESLYTINFSADFVISDAEGNVLTGQQGLAVSEIISHHQNKEVFIPFTVSQSSPFPAGDYVITYTIHDSNSENSFDIIKEITISED
jgi:hypothetical protein